jgi:hypothetical protein
VVAVTPDYATHDRLRFGAMVRNLVFFLALLGAVSLSAASVQQQRDRDKCRVFRVDISHLDSCDYLK